MERWNRLYRSEIPVKTRRIGYLPRQCCCSSGKSSMDQPPHEEDIHSQSLSLNQLIWNRDWSSVRSRIDVRTPERDEIFEIPGRSSDMVAYSSRDIGGERIRRLNEAQTPDQNGSIPLHTACMGMAPASVVRDLLEVFPEGAAQTNHVGGLPIHYACWYRNDVEVVRAVLEAYPRGAEIRDEFGFLPLHIACLKESPPEVVNALLEVYPEAARTTDEYSQLPIHYASYHGAPTEVLRTLLSANPQGASKPSEVGYLPIHIEFRRHPVPRTEVILDLLDWYPDAARLPDKNGQSWSMLFRRIREEE